MTSIQEGLAKEVEKRAQGRCEYCKIHQSLQGATFHVEHVVPRCRGGETMLDNLAWACPSCNLHKSDRVEISLPGETVRLFNPRRDRWGEHFRWEDFEIVGQTEIGRVTVEALRLKQERKLKIRLAEQTFGLFPPDS